MEKELGREVDEQEVRNILVTEIGKVFEADILLENDNSDIRKK